MVEPSILRLIPKRKKKSISGKDEEEDDHPRLNYSDWLVTISSNVRGVKKNLAVESGIEILPETFTEPYADALMHIYNCAISKDKQDYIFKAHPQARQQPFKASRDIVSIDSEVVSEIGTKAKGGRIHIHAILRVVHTTLLQIDAPRFREVLKECLAQFNKSAMGKGLQPPIKNVYAHLKWIPSFRAAENYLAKQGIKKKAPFHSVKFWEDFDTSERGSELVSGWMKRIQRNN